MKKIIGLTLAAIMVMTLVGVGTWALFSDTETSAGNTFTAGTLNLENIISGTGTNVAVHEEADGVTDYVTFGSTTPLIPGASGTITWTLSNTGMSGTLKMVAITGFNENTPNTEPELAADSDSSDGLGQKLMVWVTRGGTDILGTTLAYVPMSGLEAAMTDAIGQPLVVGTPLVYVLHWEIPTTVGNEIQGDSATLGITFTLDQ
jgi:spore coat-associated protein N